MKYLKDLIERLGQALRGKTAPSRARQASASTAPPGPVKAPVAPQDPQ